MNELLVEFLTETSENLAVLDLELVKLEQDPNAPGLLSNIFRLVHTIKGTCGFLGLPRLEKVAHASENVLGKFRDGELVVTTEAITVILEAIDCIKRILGHLEATETEPEGDDAALIATLNQVAEGGAPPVVQKEAPPAPPAPAVASATAIAVSSETLPTSSEPPPAAAPAAPPPSSTATMAEGPRESSVALQSIRVNVDLLENLMTTVSELVLSRNQLLQIARSQKDSEFVAPLQRLNQVVSELQEGVMKTRMQPIGNAWAKLPRIVRDLAHETGKKIDLVMEGAETELDRQVLELIKDPLTHMVRNSADHGIELPEERLLAGKAETGVIRLVAFHQGGHIVLEIGDDGRGLAIDKIKAKAVAKGVASEAEIAQLSEVQIQQFIFRPGFSTAEKVTSVSGRGVGMDVVKTNIEKIGGSIELSTKQGVGSKFTIKIPLTLAIVSALIVEVAGERFAVPQTAVVELVRTSERGTNKLRIERIKGAPVLRLRDRLLPLVVLEELLQLQRPDRAAEDDHFVVVTQVGQQTFGMIVDQVFDTEEIVVKPVAPVVRHLAAFSGNTILGDGSVIMILDPGGIAAAIGDVAVSGEPVKAEAKQQVADGRELRTLLVFRAGPGGPKAVPLSLVARLEEFDRKDIERANGQHVIQYRGKLTPMVPFDPNAAVEATGTQPALVFADRDKVMALMVDEIVDIVETPVDIHLESDLPGIIGSAIIAGRATELIDASHFVRKAYPDWFEAHETEEGGAHRQAKRVLLVDDSPFFRELVAPLLTVEGYRVTAAASGREALQLCERGDIFDIILSDIEMPGMSGYELAAKVKQDARWRNTPLVALTAHVAEADRQHAFDSGFDAHVAKFDRTAILETVSGAAPMERKAA
jgi:two-component system chemotaxis sensor kinase CheA